MNLGGIVKAATPAIKSAGKVIGKAGKYVGKSKFGQFASKNLAKFKKNIKLKNIIKTSKGNFRKRISDTITKRLGNEYKGITDIIQNKKSAKSIITDSISKKVDLSFLDAYKGKSKNEIKNKHKALINESTITSKEYQSNIKVYNSRTDELNSRITNLKKSIEELKERRLSYLPDDFEITNKIAEYDSQIETANLEIAKIDKELESFKLLNIKNVNKDKLKSLNDQRFAYQEKIKSLQDDKKSLIDQRTYNKEELFKIDQEIAKLQIELAEAQSELYKVEANREYDTLKKNDSDQLIQLRLLDQLLNNSNSLVGSVLGMTEGQDKLGQMIEGIGKLTKSGVDATTKSAEATNDAILDTKEKESDNEESDKETSEQGTQLPSTEETDEKSSKLSGLLDFIGTVINVISTLFMGFWEFLVLGVVGAAQLLFSYKEKIKNWWLDTAAPWINSHFGWLGIHLDTAEGPTEVPPQSNTIQSESFYQTTSEKTAYDAALNGESINPDAPSIDDRWEQAQAKAKQAREEAARQAELAKKELDSNNPQVSKVIGTSAINNEEVSKEVNDINNTSETTVNNVDNSVKNETNNTTTNNNTNVIESTNSSNIESNKSDNKELAKMIQSSESINNNQTSITNSSVNDSADTNKRAFFTYSTDNGSTVMIPDSSVISSSQINNIDNGSKYFDVRNITDHKAIVDKISNPINDKIFKETISEFDSLSNNIDKLNDKLSIVEKNVINNMNTNSESIKESTNSIRTDSAGRDVIVIEKERVRDNRRLEDQYELNTRK